MEFDERVDRLIAFFATHNPNERRLDPRTARRLAQIDEAYDAAPRPCNRQDLRRAAGPVSGSFGYDQLGSTATWPRAARRALAAYQVATAPRGAVVFSLRETETLEFRHRAFRLVSVGPDRRTVDCAVIRTTDAVEPALHRLLQPLLSPPYVDVDVTVIDAARLVDPGAHPIRAFRGDTEYAVRARGRDAMPITQVDLLRDPLPTGRRTVEEALIHAARDSIDVRDVTLMNRLETVHALDRAADSYLFINPRPSPTDPATTHSGYSRGRRVSVLAQMAAAVERDDYDGDVDAVAGFYSRESALPTENLCLLRAVVEAAGVAVQR